MTEFVVWRRYSEFITEEVLHGRGDAGGLHAFNVAHRHGAGEEGIFTEILEVAAVHGSAIDVYAGAKQEVGATGT